MAERQKPPCGPEIRAPPLVSGSTAPNQAASLLPLPLQSMEGAARARGAPPAAKPSHPTSRRSPFTSSPAATSCAAPAWPRSRKPRPWRAGAASARWPRRTSGGFTSNPPGGRESEELLLLLHTRTTAFGEPALSPASPRGFGAPRAHRIVAGGGGSEQRAEGNKSHNSFFNKELVFRQSRAPPSPRLSR